jgi:hypothetical protein
LEIEIERNRAFQKSALNLPKRGETQSAERVTLGLPRLRQKIIRGREGK